MLLETISVGVTKWSNMFFFKQFHQNNKFPVREIYFPTMFSINFNNTLTHTLHIKLYLIIYMVHQSFFLTILHWENTLYRKVSYGENIFLIKLINFIVKESMPNPLAVDTQNHRQQQKRFLWHYKGNSFSSLSPFKVSLPSRCGEKTSVNMN